MFERTIHRASLVFLLCLVLGAVAQAADRPNILWLTSEDHGPHLGCYGDRYATTPHIDRLAARGMIYTRAWSCAPVCAPARTTLISGLYPPSTGAEHMRSSVPMPAGKKMYPEYLREAGYYCTNNSKTDYNLREPGKVWDESSAKAHWRHRQAGQPFFAVFNSTKSHESQIRRRPHKAVHDPATVRVPAYHPDTPEVREDWAQYYDQLTAVDADAGKLIKELEASGLTEDTIVFYYADHGPGMPRSKRWPYNSGLRVPLVVYIPEKFKHLRPPDYRAGGASDRLASFVDFAPTVLSLAGVKPPDWMQGHAFLGEYQEGPQPFLYGFRGRMDERYDLVRTVTDGRHVYLRQYMPHEIYGQHVGYMFETPTTQVWKRLHDEGRLTPAQDVFWQTKPPEELYDLESDPDEVRNVVDVARYQDVLAKLRQAHRDWELRIRDVGFLPEGEIHARSHGSTPYDMGHDDAKYPFARVFETADLASRRDSKAVDSLKHALADADSAVRYWAALGLAMRNQDGVRPAHDDLTRALDDSSPYVRIAAAEALGRFGNSDDLARVLPVLGTLADWSKNDVFTVMAALNAIDALGRKAMPLRDTIARLPAKGPAPHARYSEYVPRLLADLKKTLK